MLLGLEALTDVLQLTPKVLQFLLTIEQLRVDINTNGLVRGTRSWSSHASRLDKTGGLVAETDRRLQQTRQGMSTELEAMAAAY